MMTDLYQGLRDWGVPENDIKYEAFGPATVTPLDASKADGATDPEADITVTFGKSGKSCKWTNEASSLLELAEMNDVVIDFGCQVGHCNTCLTAIKEGAVNYTHEPVIPPEQGTCLACISVPQGDLVLDA